MSSPPTLLVVDDSKMSRMLIRSFINAARPDWVVIEAGSGDEALQRVEADAPTFVTMDVNMPGMNGLEAAGRIRLRHPDIRIVICSANIQESVRESARRAGVNFVSKPITADSIAAAIACFEGAA